MNSSGKVKSNDGSVGDRGDLFLPLFLSHQQQLYLHIFSLVPQRQDAADILQQTALMLWKKFDEFSPGSDFLAWASRIAYLEVLHLRRGKARHNEILDHDVLDQVAAAAPQQQSFLDTSFAALEFCLARLSTSDSDLLKRRYERGESGSEIANQLGRPANSISKSLGRIRRALAECIRRRLAIEEQAGGAP
ncbi:MAG: sigma-70 family RNA polymerase sigma factor [Planctomycetes bacterium]|nr:sigma-70 family RNA polymerase sigma factor [Planctomycetota bacterium]